MYSVQVGITGMGVNIQGKNEKKNNDKHVSK